VNRRSPLGEADAMQNAGLGAAIIWRFACGHSPANSAAPVPLPLILLPIPMVLHARTRSVIEGTQTASGLRKFAEKFDRDTDGLMALHGRVLRWRAVSLGALRIAAATSLVTIVPSRAVVWPTTQSRASEAPKSVDSILRAAERIGAWCAQLSLFEISGTLHVEF